MRTSVTNEMQATLAASYIFLFLGWNIAFSADIEDLIPSKTITIVEESFIGSINVYGSALSGLSVGYLVNKIGRKNVILISMLLNLAGWTIIAFFVFNIQSVYLGRAFCGLAVGMKSATTLYISETVHKSRRGRLQALSGLIASIGVSLVYTIQYFFSSKILALVGFAISLAGSIQAYFLHETKYYLLMKNDLKEAQNSMLWFDQTMTLDEVNQEIEEIQVQQRGVKRGSSIFKIFHQLSILKSLLICLIMCILRVGGSWIVITAYPYIFYSLFLLPISGNNMTLIQGVNEVTWSVINVFVIDSRPRKFMIQWCCWIPIACLIIFCFQKTLVEEMSKIGELIILFFLILYLGIITGFLLNLTIICVSEIASSNSEFRAIIFSLVQFCEGLLGAIYANFYPFVIASLPSKFIFIFMACCLAGLSFVTNYVPETRGKALHRCEWQEVKNQHNYEYVLTAASESDISTGDEDS